MMLYDMISYHIFINWSLLSTER